MPIRSARADRDLVCDRCADDTAPIVGVIVMQEADEAQLFCSHCFGRTSLLRLVHPEWCFFDVAGPLNMDELAAALASHGLPSDGSSVEAPMPPALLDELLKLDIDWAKAHPAAFERAAVEVFDGLITYMTDDVIGPVAEALQEAEKDVSKVLEMDEFKRQAPARLRDRVRDTVKLLRALRLQAVAGAEAIREAAGK